MYMTNCMQTLYVLSKMNEKLVFRKKITLHVKLILLAEQFGLMADQQQHLCIL